MDIVLRLKIGILNGTNNNHLGNNCYFVLFILTSSIKQKSLKYNIEMFAREHLFLCRYFYVEKWTVIIYNIKVEKNFRSDN